jgi:predicted Zn-dependent protease
MSEPPLRTPVQLVAVVSLMSIAASLMLVPRGAELGYLHLKNNDTEQARNDFERLYAKGDRSPTTMSSLITLAEARSDPETAIRYLKEFVSLHPGNMVALRKLLELYREAMHPDDYLATLLEIQAVQPSAQQARELELIYKANGQADKDAAMERILIDHYSPSASDYLDLARYDAAEGNPSEAIEVLDRGGPVLRAEPGTPTPTTLAVTEESDEPSETPPVATAKPDVEAGVFQVTLLLDHGKTAQAAYAAVQWSKAMAAQPVPDDAFIIDLAQLFNNHGMLDEASRVVEPVAAVGTPTDELVSYYVQLLVDSQRLDAADKYLASQRAGRSPASLLPAEVALALGRKDIDKAFALTRAVPAANVPDTIVADLAAAAIDEERRELLQQIASRMDNDFYNRYPLIAADVFMAKGDTAQAQRWLSLAEARDTGNLREITTLEIALGHRAEAYQRLNRLAEDPSAVDFVQDIAAVLVDKGYAVEALPKFNEIRARHPEMAPGWAIVAAATPSAGAVRDWLAAQPDQALAPTFLQQLHDAALVGGDTSLRLAASRRWNALQPGAESNFALLNDYAAAGDFQHAMPLLAAAEGGNFDLHDFYDAALSHAAAMDDGELRAKSIAFWSADLKTASNKAERMAAVEALVELKQDTLVLGPLSDLAKSDPLTWGDDYIDVLERLGNRDRLAAFLTQRSRDPRVSPADRRDMAYRLLELNDKAGAIAALEINAANEPPTSEDYDELSFVWGPARPPEEMSWLKDRAAHAPTQYRAAWAKIVSGGEEATAPAEDDAEPAISRNPEAAKAAGIASAALDKGEARAALVGYKQALAADPANPDIARALGLVEFDLKHYDDAKAHIDIFYATGKSDGETDQAYGEILKHDGRNADAAPYFKRALDRIAAEPAPSFEDERTKAALLVDTDRLDDARSLYKALVADHPSDKALRAEYVDLLLNLGETDAAQAAMGEKQ